LRRVLKEEVNEEVTDPPQPSLSLSPYADVRDEVAVMAGEGWIERFSLSRDERGGVLVPMAGMGVDRGELLALKLTLTETVRRNELGGASPAGRLRARGV
jgi:hypothetical protein